MNWELIDVQLGLENVEEERDQIANVCWIVEKAKDFQENTYFCYTDYTNAFHCVDHNKYLWKILKKTGSTRPPYLSPEKPVFESRSNC